MIIYQNLRVLIFCTDSNLYNTDTGVFGKKYGVICFGPYRPACV